MVKKQFKLNLVDLLADQPDLEMDFIYNLRQGMGPKQGMEILHGTLNGKKMDTIVHNYELPVPIDQELVISLGADEKSNIQLSGSNPLVSMIEKHGFGNDRGKIGYFYSIDGDKWRYKQVSDMLGPQGVLVSETSKPDFSYLKKTLKAGNKIDFEEDTALRLSLNLLDEHGISDYDAAVLFRP